jgi:Holliday junction resolvasome RuvABC DNA-binding subunit
MEYITPIIFVIVIILTIVSDQKKEKEREEEKPIITVRINPPKKNKSGKRKVQSDPIKQSAKSTLVTFGYSATEAKKALEGLSCNSVEEYVNQVMCKVKI